MQKLRILIIGPAMGLPIPPVGWGGIERVIYYHADELRRCGHTVEIFNVRDFVGLERLIAKKWDVVHVHQEWPNDFLNKQKIPYIFTSHMSTWQKNWNSVGALLRRSAMAMPFEKMSDRLQKENYHTYWPIWNGANRHIFKPMDKEMGLCVAVGHDEPRKKFGEIIAAVKRQGLKLELIGPKNERYHDPQNKIFVYPNMLEEELAKHIGKSSYFYHLAEEEADCLVCREAAMCGCKLVLSKYCYSVLFSDDGYGVFDDRIVANPSQFSWEAVVENLEEGYAWYLKQKK